jgi:Concanavalin A-like lectin/glucanases superfamily/Calcineurin-like phosphoesterase
VASSSRRALVLVVSAFVGACGDDLRDRDGADTGTGESGTSTGEGAGPPPADSDAADGDALLTCADQPPPARSAVAFDGLDDHITMGAAPELGLATFTLEAWVRRDGAGQETTTSVDGLELVPIAGKGRGENYALGFADNVLAADFEDSATDANYPVVGTTAITWGAWHHVAATYDGVRWRLYVDGKLDALRTVGATPRTDGTQHFAIGTAMDSTGHPRGHLAGAVDEVRLWDHARSEAELAAAMFETVESGRGLVARWALDEADGGAPDGVGNADGTLVGAMFVPDGAGLDRGLPPSVVTSHPLDAMTLPADAVELGIALGDPDQDELVATFHLREVVAADDFTIVVLPDTQYYSDVGTAAGGSPEYFHDQTQWVRDNREAYDIVAVIHNGDIVNHGAAPEEWEIADAAMARLETPEPELPAGVPYGVCIGNNDQDAPTLAGATLGFNQHFGVERFAGRPYYGGHFADDNDENWFTFQAGGLQFVVVDLQFDTSPDPAVNAWARSIFEAHPAAFGILNTHYILGGSGSFGVQGQAIYDELRATDNVQLMTCGHISAESRRTDVYEGNVIHSMLADYQSDGDGGSGYLRIWEFSPANDELTVRSYSPSLDRWLTDDDSEFTLAVELPGAGGPFTPVAIVVPAAGVVATTLEGLLPGRTYEWYATASDCTHTVSTRVWRFTTQP